MANPFLLLGGVVVGVVTAGIGVLAVPGWVSAAQDSAARNDIQQVALAQEAQSLETGRYVASFSELESGSSVRVQRSAGVKLQSSANQSGEDHIAVARSQSGAYFARVSGSTKVGHGTSIESALIDAGATISGPANARVTNKGVPVPAAQSMATEVVHENLARQPDYGAFTRWEGTAGNVQTGGFVDAPWSETGRAWRATWISAGSPNSGDTGVGMPGLTAGKTYTVSYKVLSNSSRKVNAILPYHSSGNAPVLARSGDVNLTAGVPALMYATFTVTAAQAGAVNANFRAIVSPQNKVAGDYFEISDVMLYEGAYEPGIGFYTGDTPSRDGLNFAWVGPAGSSNAVAYR